MARRGVVLASGGYEGNAELVARFEGLPDWMNPFVPTNEGDAMVMATELGAAVYRSSVNHSLLVGCAVPGDPDEFYSIGLRGMPWPGAIAVNERGDRFCDESSFQDVVMAFQKFDRTRHRFVNLPAFMIFDDRFRQRYPIAGNHPGAPAPDWVVRAETLAELARQIGVDPAGLEKTVRTFNQDTADGEDRAFGRGKSLFSKSTAGDAQSPKSAQLAPLQTPPYYGIRLKVGGICSAGVLTDTHGAVKHVRGHTIPGLYACGNAAAPADTGVGYQGGTSLGSGAIFGFLAVEHAAMAG
jgi:succinate dehydrogenase/fumarate reductase flavoprotein subunit